jgi:hypothetical protein
MKGENKMQDRNDEKKDTAINKTQNLPVVIKVMDNDLVRLLDLYRGCDVEVGRTPAVGEWVVIIK